ncbi:MAG: class I SAM-dependent methyltransferase [candidate division WOR-3 bacterium]
MEDRFKRIKKIYDYVNFIFSFGIDHFSRWYLSRKVKGIICDIGTGKGELALYLSKRKKVKKIFAIDISKDMLEKRKLKEKIFYLRANAFFLPFKEKKFDFVVNSFVLRNVGINMAFFNEIKRVLKDGGNIYILDMTRPLFPYSLIFIPYIYIFTKFLSIFYPEYNFLRESILSFKARDFVKKFEIRESINIFGTIFYLFRV